MRIFLIFIAGLLIFHISCTQQVSKEDENSNDVYNKSQDTCGNGKIDSQETCDGSNLNNHTCISLGFASGTLSCYPKNAYNECTLNTTSCVPYTSQNSISINPLDKYQIMDGVGACSYMFPYVSDMGWEWNKVKTIFDRQSSDFLDLKYIRLASWFGFFENSNDNNDPKVIDWNSFRSNWAQHWNIPIHHDLEYAMYLYNETGIKHIHLGVWTPESWLASGTNPKSIPASNYLELGESISAYLLNLESPTVDYNQFGIPSHWQGVPQSVVEVQNEPAIEAGVKYPNPEALRDAALAVIEQLDHFGLSHVKLHGPNFHRLVGTEDWAKVWFANSKLKNRTQALSYHTWWDGDKRESEYRSLWNFAKSINKPVWATEVGYCALDTCTLDGKTHHLRPETWGTAWDFAQSYYRAIAWSHASRVYHWSALGHSSVVYKNGDKTPSYYILKHLSLFIPENAVFVSSTPFDSELRSMLFLLPNGEYSAIVINNSSSEKEFKFELHDKTILKVKTFKSSRENNYYKDGTINGTNIKTPPLSVNSFFLSK